MGLLWGAPRPLGSVGPRVLCGSLWGPYGFLWVPLGSLWGPYGVSMGCFQVLRVVSDQVSSVGPYWSLWVAMGPYGVPVGFLWVPMGSYGVPVGLCVPMDPYGVLMGFLWGARRSSGWCQTRCRLWVPMGCNGSLWIPLGSLRVSLGCPQVLGAARATRAALDEVTSRHRELQRLERAMRELQELFGALGAAVEGQGEAINRIELHILQSGTAVHKGGRQLRAAQEQQGKARRKRLIMAACLVLTLVILVAIIAASVAAG
ncbi:syntaxin-2-like isoform X1 [Lagopus leucura]|uniref:syntaxin-2-like isoform X1 n=1 Tax=Lagopus leucura TaxID=30410 RepID=UPI001C6837DE|nr:syntaxin-2-like isoform X1 [Lagopus leucura]